MGRQAKPGWYLFMEEELQKYYEHKAEFESLREAIIRSSGDTDMPVVNRKQKNTSDVTQQKVFELRTNTRLRVLEETLKAIETVHDSLDKQKQTFVRMCWWEGRDQEAICDLLHISRSTFFRWCREIIEDIAKKRGLIDGL